MKATFVRGPGFTRSGVFNRWGSSIGEPVGVSVLFWAHEYTDVTLLTCSGCVKVKKRIYLSVGGVDNQHPGRFWFRPVRLTQARTGMSDSCSVALLFVLCWKVKCCVQVH